MTTDPQARSGREPAALDTLYRDHAAIEPEAGLDRIVLARAEQALQSTARRRPAPWIAGLATAGVLVLAVGIVVQQSPSPAERDAPVAESALVDEPAPLLRSVPRRAASEAGAVHLQAPMAEIMMDGATVMGAADLVPAGQALVLIEIRRLLEQGETDQARVLLEALRQNHPELKIPADVRSALDEPASEPE